MVKNTALIAPISGSIGAEVFGLDLRQIDDKSFQLLHGSLMKHLVLVVRDQKLSPEQHLRVGRYFGSLNVHDFVAGMAEYPEIIEVIKEPEDSGYNFGGTWHSDVSFLEEPSMASLLYAKELPDSGGDTMFANMYLAYDTLSKGLRELLTDMRAVHSASEIYSQNSRRSDKRAGRSRSMTIVNQDKAVGEVYHPVVRTHPETGRKLLYVNSNFTQRFEGMTDAESKPLLRYLYEHMKRPEFTCRVRWLPDTLIVWDNRCTQHLAVSDYDGYRRHMHRVTVNGDRPY